MQTQDKKLPTPTPKPQVSQQAQPGLKQRAQGYLQEAQKESAPKVHDDPNTSGPDKGVGLVDKRRAEVLVNSFGKRVPDVARGLAQTGALKHPGMLEALKSIMGSLAEQAWKVALDLQQKKAGPKKGDFKERHAMLGKHLHDTGRDDLESTEANEKREGITGKILAGIESATQENQAMRDKATNASKPSPKAHPYSAHGKGSNQIARLVSGHRGDEVAEMTGPETELTGNAKIGPTSVPDVDTVGSAPSNTTGAFTTNVGMYHVVSEAFAQANMVEQYASKERKEGRANTLDSERFAPNVKGPGGAIGEGLEVTGVSKQKTGMGLSKDEMQERFKNVRSTGGQTNARMILDPAYNESGKRIGWNMQTAYANNDAPTVEFSNAKDVAKSPAAVRQRAKQLKAEVTELNKSVTEIQGKIDGIPKLVENKKKGLAGRLKKAEAAEKTANELPSGNEKVEATKAAVTARAEYQKLFDEIANLEGAGKVELQTKLLETKTNLQKATEALTQAQDAVAKLPKDAPEEGAEGTDDEDTDVGGGGEDKMRGLVGGYDAKSGEWKGGRPGKPPGSDQLKGKDEGGNNLTAHHLYPWNRIEADLNAALKSKSEAGMRKLLLFAGETVSSGFWVELQKPPAERSYAFAEELNRVVPQICWSPSNVFMGPSGRGDDPHENVDATFDNGLPTHQSALAELLGTSGGIRPAQAETDDVKDHTMSPLEESKANRKATKGRLAEMLLRNLRDNGQGGVEKGHAKAYNKSDWTKDSKGAPIQVQPGEKGRKWTREGGKLKLEKPVAPTAPTTAPTTGKKGGGGKKH